MLASVGAAGVIAQQNIFQTSSGSYVRPHSNPTYKTRASPGSWLPKLAVDSVDDTSLAMARAASVFLLLTAAAAQRILVTNDDGWAVAQIRAEVDALRAASYNVCFLC